MRSFARHLHSSRSAPCSIACLLALLGCGSEPAMSLGPPGATGPIQPVAENAMPGSVSMSVPSQAFEGSLQVELTAQNSAAEIHFTVDGSVPSAASPVYDGTALSLTATTQLRAQA